jgi:hypothetical protein
VNPEMPVTTSMSPVSARVVTVQLEATTSTEVGVTIAQRIVARHPSHQALGCSARPFVKHYFRLGSAPTTLTKYNSFGSLTSAWLVSWVGLPMTGSSFDNFPCSCRTPLEPGSRTSHLDRSTTGVT